MILGWGKKKSESEADRLLTACKSVLADYGAFIENNSTTGIVDASQLPHDKKTIENATFAVLLVEDDAELRKACILAAMELAYFQDGVGDVELLPLGVDWMDLNVDDPNLASTIVNASSDRDRYETFQKLVEADQERIAGLINEANAQYKNN